MDHKLSPLRVAHKTTDAGQTGAYSAPIDRAVTVSVSWSVAAPAG